jgi:hypothetical protein
MIGVRADRRKELVALTDGYREPSESRADLLRDCARRGMRAPVLAIGDDALGFWSALRVVFPTTREQRCWFHKIANMLAARPATGVLRLSHRALAAPAHHQPESTFATVRHHGKLTHGPGPRASGLGDSVQAHQGRPDPLVRGQCITPGRPRPRRRHIPHRQAHRTTRCPETSQTPEAGAQAAVEKIFIYRS